MSKSNKNPIIVNADILSAIANKLQKLQVKSDHYLTKSQMLNVMAAEVCGDRKNFGYMKAAERPLFGMGVDKKLTKDMLATSIPSSKPTETTDGPNLASDPTAEGNLIYTAVYEHKHGTDTNVFHHEKEAEEWRQDIAEEWWYEAFPDRDFPKDREEGADEYFEKMGKDGRRWP